MSEQNWWKEGIIYQIYPRSFFDSNGDGIGDIAGIIQKLNHIYQLGVDIIWLSPIYQSPNDDNGYDISDYYDIMEEFGTMDEFDTLLEEVHKRGMRLLMDLVVNHTSDEHPWFEASRQSKDNPYRDYYIWHKPVNGGPPNNWQSFFGGSAWELDEQTGEYYLHLFTRKQPDLNWENEQVRQEVYRIMNYWLEKGVDGFRMDVIPLISKRKDFTDAPSNLTFPEVIERVYANGPKVHAYLQEMHREVLGKYDVLSIGEGVGISPEQANLYVGKSRKELNMIFHFGHMFIDHGKGGRMDPRPFSLEEFTRIFETWDRALGDEGWVSIYLGNHDFPRMVSRFGEPEHCWQESAKLLATLIFSLRGTPTVYQGDEIGMTNVDFRSVEEYRDVEFHNSYRVMKEQNGDEAAFLRAGRKQARDHARTPIQWAPIPHGGFSYAEPWIRVNSNYREVNVSRQSSDPNSILSYYKEMIALRKAEPTLVYGTFDPLDGDNPSIYAYHRSWKGKTLLVLLNFSSQNQRHGLDVHGKLLISNYSSDRDPLELRPWEANIIEVEKR